jgi:long-chain fatty acid transport protein
VAVAAAALFVAPQFALATDGHFLHGVGAVNSAMGGVAVARSTSILGAFYVNPAGLLGFAGDRTEIGFEMFKPDRSVSSAFGPVRGTTDSKSDLTPIPAFGWSHEVTPGKVVVGVAGLGVGGFGVDYTADAGNPILMPRPNGFGNLYSSFQLMKIIPAAAFAVTPKLWIGVAANIDWASLAVDPMPTAAPGMSGTPSSPRAYYPEATHAAGSFGFGAQLGLQYELAEHTYLGVSVASPQVFQKFSWNAVMANPDLPSYQTSKVVEFSMDVPAVYTAGIAWQPTSALFTAFDVKYITYASTAGFKLSGFNNDGSVKGFGWKNIAVVATGVEYEASTALLLRAGYNYSQNPVPAELSMFNSPAPAIVQHHATAGLTYKVTDAFGIDLAAYHAFANSITGPMVSPAGAAPGSSVKNELSENAFLVSFTFGRGRAR